MKLAFRNQSASIILLPDGELGDQLLDLVEAWTKNWLLQPAYWLKLSNVKRFEGRPPEVIATVIGRNGRRDVELFQQLSRYPISVLRLISIRMVEETSERSSKQDDLVDVLARYIDASKPIFQRVGQNQEIGAQLIKINLIFAPSEVTGASYPHLHEALWNFNVVVAPEDRTFPAGFDSFISSNNTNKLNGFILANTATAAGIWTGQNSSVYEEETKYSQNSVQYDKVIVQRSFTRAVISDALAIRIASHALEKLLNFNEDLVSNIQANKTDLKFLTSQDDVNKTIDEMVQKVLKLQNGELDYKSCEKLIPVPAKKISLKNRLSIFSQFVFGVILKLPLWIFTALWKGISKLITRKIDSSEGEYQIDTEIDFPKTKLDGLAESEIVNLQNEKAKAQLIVNEWVRATLRKPPPQLFSEFRRIVFNYLDNSNQNNEVKEIFFNPSNVIPDLTSTWNLQAVDGFDDFKNDLNADKLKDFLVDDQIDTQDIEKVNLKIKTFNDLIRESSNEYSVSKNEIDELNLEVELLNKKLDTNLNQIKDLKKM